MKNNAWSFYCTDNSGKRQAFTVKAASKEEAIRKGFERARKNARGDISPNTWTCSLVRPFC